MNRVRTDQARWFTFYRYPGQPFHQQAIEADHGRLKRHLRKRSGQVQFGARWVEQEPVLSQIANLEPQACSTMPA